MNGKFEDKLAQLAFGELNPEETERIEREVKSDPEALRALSLYQDMREGLRSLSDVPEDQFSKERLRDAILTQGLRPVPTRPISNRSWLWMPAAACALGFLMMYSQNLTHRQKMGTQVVINEHAAGLGLSNSNPIDLPVTPLPASVYGPFAPPKSTKQAEMRPAVQAKDPNEVDSAVLANINLEAYDPDLGNMPASSSTTSAGATTVVDNSPTTRPNPASSGPIVLIDQDTDEQTGACKATEVGSSSNVLVGG